MGTRSSGDRPVLAVDVDGVISLFGFDDPFDDVPCKYQLIDGMTHCISIEVGERLRRLQPHYEMVWATGWEDRANEYLLHLLGLEALPVLRFGGKAKFGSAHWKLDPIERYAAGRPLAWIDDSLDESCHEWARKRAEPTLLVPTDPTVGLQDDDVRRLIDWAAAVPDSDAGPGSPAEEPSPAIEPSGEIKGYWLKGESRPRPFPWVMAPFAVFVIIAALSEDRTPLFYYACAVVFGIVLVIEAQRWRLSRRPTEEELIRRLDRIEHELLRRNAEAESRPEVRRAPRSEELARRRSAARPRQHHR